MSGDVVVVAGGGGFIGGHLVANLLSEGHRVRSVDLKPLDEWYQVHEDAENTVADLRLKDACTTALANAGDVYNLAADMGGMGFIENNKALCMLSVLINTHMLQAAQKQEVQRFFYSSSACVYAADKQTDSANPGLKESDAYPALPEDGYGWEKLFSERMCRHFREDFGLYTRIGSLPQCLRSGGHVARRTREGAGRDLPQGCRSEALRSATRSRSGATASRPAASCTSTIASYGHEDDPRLATSSTRSTSAPARW